MAKRKTTNAESMAVSETKLSNNLKAVHTKNHNFSDN